MRFVDGEQCNVGARQPLNRAFLDEPFGRHIEQLQLPPREPRLDILHFRQSLR